MTEFAPTAVYLLCLITSITCSALLFRSWGRSKAKLLFWTATSFVFLSVNNLLLVADKVVFPDAYLTPARQITAGLALVILLYGFIWEVEQ
jgi:hypothetical protein